MDDIEKKYESILKLEENVNELFTLFQELTNMIDQQGEQLDNIEANLDDAIDYVEKAETHLKEAQEVHKKTRKRMCCMIFVVGVPVGTVFLLWLFGVF